MMTEYNNVLVSNLLGNKYPFFLNNADLKSSHYLYEIYSPKLNEDLIPYISMTKISEKTSKDQPSGSDSDILAICLGSKKDIDTLGTEFLDESIFRKDNYDVVSNGKNFPLISMEEGNSLQKSMIIGLRDALRWKTYKFAAERFVDVLWTQKDFIVFEIKSDKEAIWMEPVAAYRNTDVSLSNPLNIDLNKIDYPKQKFLGNGKASELNRTIKRLERDSFSKRPFVVK